MRPSTDFLNRLLGEGDGRWEAGVSVGRCFGVETAKRLQRCNVTMGTGSGEKSGKQKPLSPFCLLLFSD
jgi:hypothetical protein